MRTRPGRVESEVYFRIVHLAQVGHNRPILTPYREQIVEVALGPKGAFEKGNIGTLTRRVPTDRVVRAIQPRVPKPGRNPEPPRVTELLLMAIEWRRQLDAGEVLNQAEIARRKGITRARVSQVMGLLRLPPDIRATILTMPQTIRRPIVTERRLRPRTSMNII
jgi:hypothetical protein